MLIEINNCICCEININDKYYTYLILFHYKFSQCVMDKFNNVLRSYLKQTSVNILGLQKLITL